MGFIKIAGAALNQTPADWENNIKNIRCAIDEARKKDIQILCLPELCLSGYGCQDLFLSKWLPEASVKHLLNIKEYCRDITVSIGFPLLLNNSVYNCTALIRNKKILGIYAKQFLANDGVHYEPRWFTSWSPDHVHEVELGGETYPLGEIIFDIEGVKVGFEICEDAWVSDDIRPAKRLCEKGVQLILNPSASHFAFEKSEFRYNLIGGSSATFNCTYLYANLLGNEAGRMIYDGEVLIYKDGELIQRNNRLSFEDVNIVSAEVDFETHQTKQDPLNHDHRSREFEFWEATTLGLFDYMRKSRTKGFVLSLSGGADSSICAIMVSEMIKKGVRNIGAEKFIEKSGIQSIINPETIIHLNEEEQIKAITSELLLCAYQATENSGNETLKAAEYLAESVGARFYYWTVDDQVSAYTKNIENAIGRKLDWKTDDVTLQNIQARSRAPGIWMLANIRNALLITTSNRSEADVGYATMDGDTSGSISPVAGVDKHFIRKWLKWAEEHQGQYGLAYVNKLAPTAELRPQDQEQTDEGDLMPYHIMVEIERRAIRDRMNPAEAYKLLKEENLEPAPLLKKHIKKFYQLWSRNQWKRERYAPSFHLDEFNVDPKTWCRFPILNGGFSEELKILEETE